MQHDFLQWPKAVKSTSTQCSPQWGRLRHACSDSQGHRNKPALTRLLCLAWCEDSDICLSSGITDAHPCRKGSYSQVHISCFGRVLSGQTINECILLVVTFLIVYDSVNLDYFGMLSKSKRRQNCLKLILYLSGMHFKTFPSRDSGELERDEVREFLWFVEKVRALNTLLSRLYSTSVCAMHFQHAADIFRAQFQSSKGWTT